MADSNVDIKAPPPPLDEPEEEQPTLTFHGTNGVECEDFINNVRCRALEQGRIRDNDWLVTFAKSCFRDGALEFLDSLDDSIKGDWKQLRKALLKKYQAPLWREHSSVLSSPHPSSIAQPFPDPAPAAAPPPLPPPKPLAPLPKPDLSAGEASFQGRTQQFLIKGYIKVTIPSENTESPPFRAYIAKPLDSNYYGDLKLTLDKSRALLLGYSPSQKPYVVMSVMKCKCGKDCLVKVGRPFKCDSAYGVWDFLVARWTPSLGPKDPTTGSFVAIDTYTTHGVDELAIWRIGPGCDLTPVRISQDGAHHTEVVVKPHDLSIHLETKLTDSKAPKLGGWKPAELRFEPL
ncbi:hypothetical protein M407DRAFT_29254 [Tulasnella calospora MUT 4182]|uniref:Uncharacterized protein n=1 Tax=Tulasnella calospora MUT 4182 TaxID=1051891 RepID=A0A0C3PZS8_9AGAM|nr:hypothetical protein M407DRAFT_29254 [Tulasnella calospora MUT 4182]